MTATASPTALPTALPTVLTIRSGHINQRRGELSVIIEKPTPAVPARNPNYDTVAVFSVRTEGGYYAESLSFQPVTHAATLKKNSILNLGEGLNNLAAFPRFAAAIKVLLKHQLETKSFSEEQAQIIRDYIEVLPTDVLLTENGKGFVPGAIHPQDNINYITGNDAKTLATFQRLATVFSKDADAEKLFFIRLLAMGIGEQSIQFLDERTKPTDTFPSSILSHRWDEHILETNKEWKKRGIVPNSGLASRGGIERERVIAEARKLLKA